MDTNELMVILEQLERDKGIDKEVLIRAVEAAVASAAKKIWGMDPNEEIRVEFNPKTGTLKAYAGDTEIQSSEFGRIAAQTAKQVVIQKIREAEKDVIYAEYKDRVGQIVSGNVYRFERGNIIVDLGRTEGLLPRREQSFKEEFRQGDRIRCLVMEVDREARGPQVILSRAHKLFVKKLFELEVPEIYEGIVEIKGIARAVGERTKIAVASKDEKVDPMGACVGMRGARVKNIVSELQGERIDIVRWSPDIKEFIQAALAPAEISQIQIKSDEKVANIIVADDQLSLAIGRRGQNVRLASELVGWEINIFTAEQWQKQAEETGSLETPSDKEGTPESGPTAEAVQEPNPGKDLSQLEGIGDKMIELLKEYGYETLDSLAKARPEDLTRIKGLGTIKAQKIIDQARRLTGTSVDETQASGSDEQESAA